MPYVGTFSNNQISLKFDTTSGGEPATYAEVAQLTSAKFTIDAKTENWTSFSSEGFENNFVVSKGIKIDCEAMRSIGDAANDYIAGLAMKIGRDCETTCQITFPDGNGFTIPVAVQVTALPGDDSTKLAVLKWTCLGKGKPTAIPAA